MDGVWLVGRERVLKVDSSDIQKRVGIRLVLMGRSIPGFCPLPLCSVSVMFATTRWSLLRKAVDYQSPGGSEAFESLWRIYEPALKLFLMRGYRLSSERADDLLQDYALEKLIRRRLLDHADQSRGRFRSFLLTSLVHHVTDVFRKDARRNRMVDDTTADLLLLESECATEEPGTTDLFDEVFARQVINEAMRLTAQHCERVHKPEIWSVLRMRLIDPILTDCDALDCNVICRRLGLRSARQVSNHLVTGKRIFRRNLESIVTTYGADRARLELNYFVQLLKKR
jgi:DNA-directed RNA polymerase specialized sigma24 family protein